MAQDACSWHYAAGGSGGRTPGAEGRVMGVKGRHPREGSDGGGYWKWVKVYPDRDCDGWIAGDIHVFPAHMGRPSTVCERTLTRGRLSCSCCAARMVPRDLGYLPVYRHDGLPCVLHIHEYAFDLVGAIRFRDPITWSRGSGDDSEAVMVQPRLRGGRWESTIPARMQPQDIVIAMVRYWKRQHLLPDLVRWIHGGGRTGDESPPAELVSRVTEAERSQPSQAPARKREGLSSVTGVPLEPLVTDAMKRMLARNREAAKSPPPNGEHG